MPKVSIVLPTYNGEKYIKESIESTLLVLLKCYIQKETVIEPDADRLGADYC